MLLLITGLVIFLGVHSISIINISWRDKMVAKWGLLPWQGLYSIIAITGFVLLINGYRIATNNPVLLYSSPEWLRHIALLLMVVVFPLLLATYLPGRIKNATKHPMLVATKVWALAHLLANGNLADVVMFGSFLIWAVVNRISLKQRKSVDTPQINLGTLNDILALILGMAIYLVLLFWAHGKLFGVSPI